MPLNARMPLIDRADSLLVVIDAQPGFYSGVGPDDHAAAAGALDRAIWLVGVAAALEVPIVVTEEDPAENGATDARILTQLPARTPVLTKPTFGLTGSPEIVRAVRETERGTAVLVGFETDVCIAQSAVGLVDLGLRAIVVEDATFSPGEMHERGVTRASEGGAGRNHSKGVAYEWLRSLEASRAAFGGPSRLGDAPFRL